MQARAFGAGFSFFDNRFRRDDLGQLQPPLNKVLNSRQPRADVCSAAGFFCGKNNKEVRDEESEEAGCRGGFECHAYRGFSRESGH
jgi:hypothetical protein